MAAIFTPTLILAAGGFMKGEGLGVSPAFIAAATSYSTEGLTGKFITAAQKEQAAWDLRSFWEACQLNPAGPGCAALVEEPPPAVDPDSQYSIKSASNLIPFLGQPALTAINNALAQAAKPFSLGIPGFISVYGRVSAYCSTAYQVTGAISQASSMSFSDFGAGFSNYTDMATGGITASFPDPAATATSLEQLGKAIDVTKLDSMANPGALAESIIGEGLGELGDLAAKLEDAGLTPDTLTDPSSAETVTRIFKTITGTDLLKIVAGMSWTPYDITKITTLADVMNLQLMLPPGTNIMSAAELSNAFQNIGGTFKDADEMVSFLRGVNVPPPSALSSQKSPLPADFALQAQFGSGSGVFGNPTILDLIGSAAGYVHTDSIGKMKTASLVIEGSDPLGPNLGIALDAYNTAPDGTDLTSYAEDVYNASLAIANDPNLQPQVAIGAAAYTAMNNQVTLEQNNIYIAFPANALFPLDPATISADVTQITMFAAGLHSAGVDKTKMGSNTLFANIATADAAGDTVKACLTEGINSDSLSSKGVTNPIFMDADKQAQKLS